MFSISFTGCLRSKQEAFKCAEIMGMEVQQMERKGKNTDLVSCLIRTLKEVQVSQVNNISFRYAMAGNQITYKCLKEHFFKPWYEYHVAVDTYEEDITNGRIDLAALLRSHFGIDEACTGSFSDITVGHT